MFLFLSVFWPLLGGFRFAAANVRPPISKSTLYFFPSEKTFAASKPMECESHQQGKQKGARSRKPAGDNHQKTGCAVEQAGSGNQWSNPFPPPSLSSPARCCIYITVIEWLKIPAFLQLVEGRLLPILLQLVASCCGGCLATDLPVIWPILHFGLFRLPTTYATFLHCLESF